MRATKASTPSGSASKRTVQRRNSEINMIRNFVSSADPTVQLGFELKSMSSEQQHNVLENAKLQPKRPPDNLLLSLKTQLNLTWQQSRGLKRQIINVN